MTTRYTQWFCNKKFSRRENIRNKQMVRYIDGLEDNKQAIKVNFGRIWVTLHGGYKD